MLRGQPPRAVNPRRITRALDLAGLHGPEVDAALGVPERTVDRWEEGLATPTPAQLARLAKLTRQRPEWFCLPDTPGTYRAHERLFVCGSVGRNDRWLPHLP